MLSSVLRHVVAALLAVVSSGFLPLPAQERESAAAKERIRVLRAEAEELEQRGDTHAAAEHRREAEQIERRLHERNAGRTDLDPQQIERLVRALGQGIEALQALGQHELAERVARVARETKAGPGEGRASARDGGRNRGDGGAREVEVARAQLDTMRRALGALREAERGDAAELMEQSIRAREVTLEGRRDGEAQQIRERAPDVGAQAELLLLAARLYEEWGHERDAARVGELGRQLADRARARRPGGTSERGDEPRREGDLSQRVQELERTVERLRHEIEQLRRR